MNKTVKTFEGELELGHLDMLVAASARDMWVEELQEDVYKRQAVV